MVCTPHLGASTAEAQFRVAEEIATQFVTFFQVRIYATFNTLISSCSFL